MCVVSISDGYGSDLSAAVVIRSQDMDITGDEISKLVADHFADADYYKIQITWRRSFC